MKTQKILIIGAGVTGLGLAYKLLQRKDANFEIKIIEKENFAGGLSGSFTSGGHIFDYGSHRIHPATDEIILNDFKKLLGNDLLLLKRNGRIHLINNFVKFPFKITDFFLNANPIFLVNCLKDILRKKLSQKIDNEISFADILLNSFGPALCESFYFPYAEKIWGLPPYELSAFQAKKRVSSNSFFKIAKKFIPTPSKNTKKLCFYYPKSGIGQLSDKLSDEIKKLGGSIELNCEAKKLVIDESTFNLTVQSQKNISEKQNFKADFIFSTIPLPSFIHIIEPEPAQKIKFAANHLRYRSMLIFYIILDMPRFTKYDAHYFPAENIIFSRISEPKNYNLNNENKSTGLCVEIPCFYNDKTWNSSDDNLLNKIIADFKKVKLPLNKEKIKKSFTKKIRYAYPLYDLTFQDNLDQTEFFLDSLDNIISLGRQGLFAHDNIHHAMHTAYKANECLDDNLNFDKQKWIHLKKQFKNHKVED